MTIKSATKGKAADEEWKGYVNWSPLAGDREKVVRFMGNGSFDGPDYLLQLNESGYTCTFSYDEKNSCHRLSVTGKGKHCPNAGYTLSVRASSPIRCIALASYYVYVLCESGDWLVDKSGKDIW